MFPVCSFCGERPVQAWFEGPDFVRAVASADEVRAEEAWLACATCLALVRDGDREALVHRGVDRMRERHEGESVLPLVRNLHERFWAAR